jgi:hypothetical protein
VLVFVSVSMGCPSLVGFPCVWTSRELYLYELQLGGQAPAFLGQLQALSYVTAGSSLTQAAPSAAGVHCSSWVASQG